MYKIDAESTIVSRLKFNVILTALFLSIDLFGQGGSNFLTFQSIDKRQQILDRYAESIQVVDSLFSFKEILSVVSNLQKDGYLTASLDTLMIMDQSFKALIFVGKEYEWGDLKMVGVPVGWKIAIANKKRKSAIDGEDYSKSFSRLINQANNNGFPFASTQLDSLLIVDNRVSGTLLFDSGPRIRIDTLDINGASIRKKYISSYLKIPEGSYYNERRIEQIPDYLEKSPYYSLKSPIEVLFHNTDARIGLEVERIKANRFDGIVGLLPNSSKDGKTLITGELNLELLNPFETGKELRIHWQRLREQSQYLDMGVKFPIFLGTPLDLFGEYRQLKEDTTFINRNAKLGAEISLSTKSNFKFFVDIKSAGLLSTEQEASAANLLDNIDFGLTRYGLGYSFSTLSIKDLQDVGVSFRSEFSAGSRKLRRNANIDESLYEDIQPNSAFYQIEFDFTYQTRVSRLIMLHHQLSSSYIFNENIFQNDMFRIGGLNSLRGFNENQFFARNYILSNVELRMYFENSSFLFLFSDQSYIRSELVRESLDDFPFGFGMGLQMSTKSGDFKFAYALGRSKDQAIDFNLSKIHFGIINRF